MKAIWACFCMLFVTPNNGGHVSSADLHQIIDKALADGWEPQKEGTQPLFKQDQKLR